MVMADMMKQHCLPVKKLLRAFVLSSDSRYSRRGDGAVLRNSKQSLGSNDSIFLFFFFVFVSLCFFFANMLYDNHYG